MDYRKNTIRLCVLAAALLITATVVKTAHAEDPPPTYNKGTGVGQTFNVREYLNLPGQKNADGSEKGGAQGDTYFQTEEGISPVAAFIVDVADFLAKLVGTVALLAFILGALLTITSEGREDQVQKGKDAMIYALIGLVIAFASFIIVTFVQSIFY